MAVAVINGFSALTVEHLPLNIAYAKILKEICYATHAV